MRGFQPRQRSRYGDPVGSLHAITAAIESAADLPGRASHFGFCSVIEKTQTAEACSALVGDSPTVFTPSGSFLAALAFWVAAVGTLLALLTA